MKFFIPGATPAAGEADYLQILDTLKKQLRWPITERRVYSLQYTHDKKRFSVKVGEVGGQGGNFMIVAILESTSYIVFTRGNDGEPGAIMLISKDDVTNFEDFDIPVPKVAAKL